MKTRKLAIFAAFCAMALPLLADDWEVDENTTLTADTTVDVLTVNSGVTLNLNGYSLTCTSLAGTGVITNSITGTDLTTPGGTCAKASPSGNLNKGTVANLFNNNFTYLQGDNDRILLNDKSSNLPLRIDYDFGDGNAQVVNAYKIYAATKSRAPTAWKLYGSNETSAYGVECDEDSSSAWVEVASRSGETWTGASKDNPADVRSYTCANTTAYRYYRLKVTANNGDNSYLEMVQLEYFNAPVGELHVNVANGETANWTVTVGGNVKVVKEGAGTLARSKDLKINDGALVIEAGAVTMGQRLYIGNDVNSSAAVTVNGGSLSIAGHDNNPGLFIGYNGTGSLTVNDGTVTLANNKDTYLAYNSGAVGTLNLNGGTLVTRRVLKNNGSSCALNFNGGTLKANNTVQQNGFIGSGVTVDVGANGGTIDSGNLSDATSSGRVFVAAAISGTGAMRFMGGKTINIEGACNYTGGTTVELGTMLNVTNATAKTTILGALTVDGCTKTAGTNDIPVFAYAAGGLTASDLEHITFANCGATTAAELAGDKTIQVDFVAPAWELAADTTWSALVTTYGAPAADATVFINAASAYTLTIDTDATVGSLAFSGDGSVTLAVSSDQTLTVGDITGVGAISNSGTIVKTGSGPATLPFNNAVTGTTVVNAGMLKVASQTGTGTNYVVRVKGGATFDMNGVRDTTVKVILEEGAFFVNTGGNIGHNNQQAVSITLEGNATATASGGDFGLIAPGYAATTLDLGSYTLTIQGGNTFRLCNTTIIGTGKISVTDSGTLTVKSSSSSDSGKYSCVGENCELVMGSGTTLTVGNYQSLTVKNFTNNGTINTSQNGMLNVTGTLTPGTAIRYLTLADDATVKASATVAQTVSTSFAASGTVKIDASDITSQQLAAATDGIPVLTVPAEASTDSVTWKVTDADSTNARWRWVDDAGGKTKTLRLFKPTGLIMIFR